MWHVPYHVASVSCPYINDIGTWYRSGTTWDMRWQTSSTFTFISWYHYISLHIITLVMVSCSIMLYHVVSSVWWGSLTSVWEVLVGSFLTSWGEGWSWDLPHRPNCQPPCAGSGVFLSPLRLSSTSHPSLTSGLGSWAVNCKRKAASARPVSLPWPTSSAWLQGCERKCQSCGCPCTHIRGRMDSPCSGSRRIPPQVGSSWRRQQLRRCQPASQSPCQRPWALSRRCTTCICELTWYHMILSIGLWYQMIYHDIIWYSPLDEPRCNLLVSLEPSTGQHVRRWGICIRVDALVSIEGNRLSSLVLSLSNPLNR